MPNSLYARVGSGGVGLLVKDYLCDMFNIHEVDKSTEGILWIQFTSKECDFIFYVCVCYLPPIDSVRNVNASIFFDTLLSQVYRYQNSGPIMLCGDYNGRSGNIPDFIEGVDDICDRNVVDFTVNKHGQIMCEFLLSSSCCILNGRNYTTNDFTSKDSSVVDYCFVPYEQLCLYSDVRADRTWRLMCDSGCNTGIVDPTKSVPDHNVLSWSFDMAPFIQKCVKSSVCGEQIESVHVKYDLSSVPTHFMQDDATVQLINDAIERL